MIELSEAESKRRLGPHIARPAEIVTDEVEAAVRFVATETAGRVVAKASGVAHKTEDGLVRLGLDEAGVQAAFAELAAAGDGRVVVAEMVPTDVEMIVGGVRDAVFGPVVTVGAGGVAAEAAPDVVAVLAPPEPGEVEAALATLRMAPVLRGWRGSAPLDQGAFDALVEAVSAVFDDPEVVAVDVNPVSIVDGRPVVLDALVVLDGGEAP
ncbi:MAG: acetate--CoA ligase family protein [Actinomycetota bacterium]